MSDIPQLITVGPFTDLRLEGVSYEPRINGFEVKVHYQHSAPERWGDEARSSGDFYVVAVGSKLETATANLVTEIKRLTEAAS